MRNDTMHQILEEDGADNGADILGRTPLDSGWQKPDLPSRLIVSRLYLRANQLDELQVLEFADRRTSRETQPKGLPWR